MAEFLLDIIDNDQIMQGQSYQSPAPSAALISDREWLIQNSVYMNYLWWSYVEQM